jgi:hypothetical protein
MISELKKWYDKINDGDTYPTYTRDSWIIPENGAELWCKAWDGTRTIKPYGDGCHVMVAGTCYHCDQIVELLEKSDYEWGIVGITMVREQFVDGRWIKAEVS